MANTAWVDILEGLESRVPCLYREFSVGELDFLIINSLHSRVLNGYNESLIDMVRYRTIQIGTISYNAVVPIICGDSSLFFWEVVDHLLILVEVGAESFDMSQGVIISNILLGSTSYCIMMLIYSHGVEEGVSCCYNTRDLAVSGILIENSNRVKPSSSVKSSLSFSNLPFSSSSWCEVSSPIVLRFVGIGEHVIILCGPRNICLMKSINILSWCRVHKSHVGIFGIDIINHPVQVNEL